MDVHQHMAVILIPIMLSTWIRNLKYLVPISSLANFLVIAGYVATMYIMCHDLPPIHERRYIADWHELPLFFGTVIYSFEGITLVSDAAFTRASSYLCNALFSRPVTSFTWLFCCNKKQNQGTLWYSFWDCHFRWSTS